MKENWIKQMKKGTSISIVETRKELGGGMKWKT
uniref:Uncharacterized protein n=1 Tax=Nelumbo nucifera TaxID=4432 RepID=A0A822Z406_NELNU|nr:TPA_asm: hypothetical protein HUJ06_008357 [Nelumbo nucifera]